MATKTKLKAIQLPESSSLSNRALLVSVQISQWDARRIDKAETEAVQVKHKTAKRAARVHKSLLPGAKELETIHKLSGDIRTFVYKHTLPWAEGVQILKTEGYMDFTTKLASLVDTWKLRVDEFVDAYPGLIRQAKFALGTMFDPDDYPDVSTIRGRFRIESKYLPVPEANDWRVDLGAEHVESLRRSVEDQLRQSQETAMKEAWDRLYKVCQHAHERLSKPDAIFRDSLIENAVELCELLPSLNITNDPALEQMRRQIEGSLCAYDPKRLRKNPAERANAAAQLQKAMSKMGAFYAS